MARDTRKDRETQARESAGLMQEAQFVWSVFLFAGIFLTFGVLYGIFLFTCREDACLIFRWQKIRATASYEDCVRRGFPVASGTCQAGPKTFYASGFPR